MDVTEKKKLVGLIHALEVGGAERMMLTILNHFSAQDFEVHLIIFDNNGALKKELSPNVKVHDLGIASVLKGMPKCLKSLYAIKADIVFSGIGHLNIALAPFIPLLKRVLPKTKWISRETSIVSLQNQTSKYPKIFDFLYRHTYQYYDLIITQSDDMKEDLENNYFSSSKIVKINNPIDYESVKKLAEKESIVYKQETINLITVARFREEKRHDLMLKVLALLPEKYHLTIVGSGEKALNLTSLTKHLNLENRVSFEGYKANPYPYMKEADLFLLTSEREGFPNVLLEANSLGLPIVAFACKGGIKEIIEEGENGFYVPFSECELMAKKIEYASTFSFNTEDIEQRTINKYSHKTILKKYETYFKVNNE